MYIAEYDHDLSQCQTLHSRFQCFMLLPQHQKKVSTQPPCYFTFYKNYHRRKWVSL